MTAATAPGAPSPAGLPASETVWPPDEASIPTRLAVPSAGTHVPALDAIRGLAILLVLVSHFYPRLPNLTVVEDWIGLGIETGWMGVDLFFVLSGFLITGILYDAKGGDHFFRNFYARRTLRIFPLYYGTLFALFVVLPRLPGFGVDPTPVGTQLWYWFYLMNVGFAVEGPEVVHPYLGHFWSLSIEEQYYFLWPAFVFLFERRTLMRLCAAGFVGSFLLRIAFHVSGAESEAVALLLPTRVDGLAAGSFLALAARGSRGLVPLVRRARPVLLGAALLLIVLFVVRRGWEPEDPWVQMLGLTALAGGFAALLVLAISAREGSRANAFFHSRFLRMLGRYSYAMYVFHWPIFLFAHRVGFFGDDVYRLVPVPLVAQALYIIALSAITLALAFASWHLYEKRFLELKRFFPYEKRRLAARQEALSGA